MIGSAGTGKSFLLKRIVGMLPPDTTFVTASTGIAACHIGGTTLHSFAGIGNGNLPLNECINMARRKSVVHHWKTCKHLIIDEISMVDGEFFEKMEAVARNILGNDKPFGGIQLILCGDFLQLPPVSTKGAKKSFCFQTSAWDKCINTNIELLQVKRQNDPLFIEILQNIRIGRCNPDHEKVLAETVNNNVEREGIKATRLCTHKDDVEHINSVQLKKLPGDSRIFSSVDSDPYLSDTLDNSTPVLGKLHLKVGAQVMLMKNLDVSQGLVNGARGVVTGFSGTGLPIVKFTSGMVKELSHEKWSIKARGGLLVTRRQIPLKLAWAFSIHKSQGMTLDCVEMSLSKVFEAGQAYVALSRARNLKSLRILDFNTGCIKAHPDVQRFYYQLRKDSL
ncbi:ATP-dependent DNA helicase PIF1 [Armadillidium nasatum]|uniref:ATP-dependent DNA helicase n=1 Tax=Armadillidium nasatum TaxID=96803 RepID=A0A5N5SV06_9CRUS|nr:ATP-dependent DNA helicase PIF1 [Armadillidium nasatum]